MSALSRPIHDPLLDVDQAAALLGLSPFTVRHWARERRLPAVKLGKLWKFRESSLRAFIAERERDAK
jgi:excisionase family DNA binding protein